jgi:hypothetical protein
MVTIEKVAQYALFSDDIKLSLLVEAFLAQNPNLASVPKPLTDNLRVLAVAAGLIELFALRAGQPAPEWTRAVGAIPTPFFLRSSAAKWPRLRQLCLDESPEPLRKRNLYATADFLQVV